MTGNIFSTVILAVTQGDVLPENAHMQIARELATYGKSHLANLRCCSRYWKGICTAEITASSIDADHLAYVMRFLRKLPSLHTITVRGHPTQISTVHSNALATLTSGIRSLSLTSGRSNRFTRVSPDWDPMCNPDSKLNIEDLSSLLSPFAQSMTSLSLSNCRLAYTDGNILWQPSFLAQLPHLLILHVSSIRAVGLMVSEPWVFTWCPGLQELTVNDCSIALLDVKSCQALRRLDCSRNVMGAFDASSCTNLRSLDCVGSSLRGTLDVSTCMSLQHLDFSGNKITFVHLPDSSAFEELACENNGLTTLDLSRCLQLSRLRCKANNLETLSLPPSACLQELQMHTNHPSLSLSGHSTLLVSSLSCDLGTFNSLSPATLSGVKQLSMLKPVTFELTGGFQNMQVLDCWIASQGSINLTSCTSPVEVSCKVTASSLHIIGCNKVWKLAVQGIGGPPDLKGFSALSDLNYHLRNLPPSLDLSVCKQTLRRVHLSYGGNSNSYIRSAVTHIDLTGCALLEEFYCEGYLDLVELDLTPCTGLMYLRCIRCGVKSLDVSMCPLLVEMDVSKDILIHT